MGNTFAGEWDRDPRPRGGAAGVASRGLSCALWLAVAICMNDADETTLRSVRDSGVVAELAQVPCTDALVDGCTDLVGIMEWMNQMQGRACISGTLPECDSRER